MLQSMGSQRVGHDWATALHWTAIHVIIEDEIFVLHVYDDFLLAEKL